MRKIVKRTQAHGVTKTTDAFGFQNFNSGKVGYTPPIITEVYEMDGKVMFECAGNRHFAAEGYIKTFVPEHKQQAFRKKYL